MRRSVVIAVGVLLGILVVGYGVFSAFVAPRLREQEAVRSMPINEVPLSKVRDGTYEGDFSYGGFTYLVEVSVGDQRIQHVEILQNRERSEHAKEAEAVIDSVLSAQSLNVDAVTGATTTSKALLKAIERALAQGLQE